MAALALVVTAVDAERDAVTASLGRLASVELGPFRAQRCLTAAATVDVVTVGAGPVAAAAGTATCLGLWSYDLVVCAGVAGRYVTSDRSEAPHPGGAIVADRVALDGFGAESAEGFIESPELGLGANEWSIEAPRVRAAAARIGATQGTVVTVLAATGTRTRAMQRSRRWDAKAEAMEGAGVLAAARLTGTGFLEVRTFSNEVGDRDRQAWDLPGACNRLGQALYELFAQELP